MDSGCGPGARGAGHHRAHPGPSETERHGVGFQLIADELISLCDLKVAGCKIGVKMT